MEPSEGKVTPKLQLMVDDLVDEFIYPNYPAPNVLGLIDVANGYRPYYPTTVYQVSGDDTSGIVGLLYPNGDFLIASTPGKAAQYWEFDETLGYKKITVDSKQYVVGDSWTRGEVTWDGSVAGSVNVLGRDGDKEGPVNKREWDASLHDGDWITTGELWRALMRGTPMHNGPTSGRIHTVHSEENLRFAA